MVKIGRYVTIDEMVFNAAKRAGFNISEAAERGIADTLHMNIHKQEGPQYSRRMEQLLKVITGEHKARCSQKVKEDRTNAIGWAKVFKRQYALIIMPAEIMEVFG